MKKKTVFFIIVKILVIVLMIAWTWFSPDELFLKSIIGFFLFCIISWFFGYR